MRVPQLFALVVLGISLHCSAVLASGAQVVTAAGQRRVLVYTRNGVEYVHANIAASVEALKKVGAEAGFAVDATEDPEAFSAENLKRYAVIVFSNSNNEIFTSEEQRAALKGFVEHGGGVVGVHSSIGSERNWEWFAQMMGGRFRWHPVEQDFTVQVADAGFPVVQGLPAKFTVHDECYFIEKLNPDVHPVLVTDRTVLTGLEKAPGAVTDFPNALPLAWWHTFDGGREFFLALGHEQGDYEKPWMDGVLRRAIVWAAGQ